MTINDLIRTGGGRIRDMFNRSVNYFIEGYNEQNITSVMGMFYHLVVNVLQHIY